MRVLFALNYINSSKQISKLYKKNYKESLDIDVTNNKLDTFKLLKEKQYDVLIINSTLDGQAILFSEIDYIFKSQLANRIILLMDSDEKNSKLPQMLYNLGLFDGLYEDDSTNINISELINEGRDINMAREYYNASDEINLLDDKDIDLIEQTELLMLLEKMKELNSEQIIGFFDKLKEIYTNEQLKYLIENTDLEIRGKLINTDIYKTLVDINYNSSKVIIDDENIASEYIEESVESIKSDSQEVENFISDIEDEFDDLDDLDLDNLYISNNSNTNLIDDEDIEELDELPSFYEEVKNSSIAAKSDIKEEKNFKPEIPKKSLEQPKVVEKIVEVEKVIEKVIEVEKVVEVEKIVEVERVVEKVIQVDKNVFNRVIIGVIGVKKGIGTTYNSISIAKYLAKDYKVAVVEFKKDFLDIAEAYEIKVKDNMFTFENVDYFSINIDELYKKVLNLDYQYIVVDFGAYSDEIVKDFYRTDIKLVLCGTQIWEDKYLSKFLTDQQVVNGVKYLFNMSKYRSDIVENMPGLEVLFIDYFENISLVSNTYQSILQEFKVSDSNSSNKKKGLLSTILGRG